MNKYLALLLLVISINAPIFSMGNSEQKASTNEIVLNDGYPIVDETITLHMVAKKDPTHANFSEMPFIKKYEKQTNVHIEWEEIPISIFEEKKNLILAGGDLPDAFFNQSLSAYDVATYGPQGYFLPLENLIEEYAPNIKRIFELRPDAKAMSTCFDGHIYTLPYIEEMGIIYIPSIFYINKTWLKNLNLEVPTTTEEFYEVLKAFKTQDPNGNGIEDEIPFTGIDGHSQNGFYSLFGSFGRADNLEHMVVENGKAIFTADKDEYKEAIKYLNKLYKEGLIDPEYFTQDFSQLTAKGNNPENIIGSMIVWRDFQVVGNKRASEDFMPIAPLKGPNGDQVWGRANNSEIRPNVFAISADNPYPELTMRWVDGLYDEMTSIELNWGTFGDIQKLNDKGLYVADYNDYSGKGLTRGEVRAHNTPANLCGGSPCSILMDVYGRIIEMEPGGAGRKVILDEIYSQFVPDESYPVVNMSLDDTKTVNSIRIDLIEYVNEMAAKWIVKGGIDEDWSSYLKTLKELRLDEYMEIHQKVLDQYNASKN